MTLQIRLFLIFILSTFGTTKMVSAVELYELNTSVRALGMGNAYTAVVDNADALFYNPAGLSRVRGLHLTFFDPHLGGDDLGILSTAQNLQSQSSFISELQKQYGKNYWAGGGAKGGVAIKNFAAAVYDSLDASLGFANPANPQVNASLVNDYGLAVGASFDVPFFAFGAAAKRISRYGGRTIIGADTLSQLSASQMKAQIDNRGTAYSLDLGLLFSIPSPVSPRFSFVMKDVGQTTFTSDFGIGRVPNNSTEMIAGFAFDLIVPDILRLTPSVDYAYIDNTTEQIGKKIHMGVELELPLITVRAGFNQGYYTAGAGLDLGVLKFDAATYGVELGAYPGQKEDRRYMIQFSFELDFGTSSTAATNPDGTTSTGSITNSIFGSRHVKARR